MKKLFLILLFTSCKKLDMRDPITDGAKLTKADAGKTKTLEGVWWSEKHKDSLVIQLRSIDDSVRYKTNMIEADKHLTHSINYEPKDENIYVLGSYWRIQH